MRRLLPLFPLLALSLTILATCIPAASAEAPRPNIILIAADDMGWSDLGCYGSEIATPTLDRLAAGGVRFTQFYNTSKCFPSRACLLTGVYAQQCGMAGGPSVIRNAVTLGEVLRSAGYRTLWSGKHHGTENPYFRGFDRYYGLRDGACNFFNPGLQRESEPKPAQKRYGGRTWCIDEETIRPYTPPKDFYATDYFAKYAINWLDEYKDENKPFFLYVAFNAPHDPMMAWPEDIAKYRGKYKAGYEAIRQARYEKQVKMGLVDPKTCPLSPREGNDWDELTDEKRDEEDLRMAVYAAMIDCMDRNIGKILAKVEELGETENTLVLFVSDNGGSAEVVRIGDGEIGTMTRWASVQGSWANVSNCPLRKFKNYSHEGGIRTPLVAYWPAGIENPGRITSRVGHFIDLMATFVELSGAEYPTEREDGEQVTPLQGESFTSVLRDQEKPREKPIFWQWSRGKAVRVGQWKLVSWGDGWQLYNIEQDRSETNDLAEEHPEKVDEMAKLWEAWRESCGKKP